MTFISQTNCVFSQTDSAKNSTMPKYAIVVHGGAGSITKTNMSDGVIQAYQVELKKALDAGAAILKSGGTSIDAVEAAINIMEDSPLFNAGKGAVLTANGKAELDASIMDGKTMMAGAVAGVRDIKNPISAAKLVMQKSDHVLLSGKGASQFAKLQGLTIVPNSYFITDKRKEEWKAMKNKEKENNEKDKHGTCGCVALDTHGNLAAGTSTGGTSFKKWGRIGDSPIIGAGTYASNSTCAVSSTGHGEFFIRYVAAYRVAAMMEFKKSTLAEASNFVVNDLLKNAGGRGGMICIDHDANIAMPFNTEGMFRGFIKSDGTVKIEMFK